MMLSRTHHAPSEDALAGFRMDLLQIDHLLSLHDLTRLIARHALSRAVLEEFLTTDSTTYAHREVFRSQYLEAGCIGWRRGQHTPIHDHAESVCAVLILDGVLRNTDYRAVPNAGIVQGATRWLRRGEMIGFERGTIHRMTNDQLAPLFTLHVYSPPLTSMHERIRPEASVQPRSPGRIP